MQKCGICLSKGEIQPGAGGTKHKGNSRDTPPASRDKCHPTGLILPPEEWFNSRSAGSSPGRAGARASALQEFCSQFILQKAPRLFFPWFPSLRCWECRAPFLELLPDASPAGRGGGDGVGLGGAPRGESECSAAHSRSQAEAASDPSSQESAGAGISAPAAGADHGWDGRGAKGT